MLTKKTLNKHGGHFLTPIFKCHFSKYNGHNKTKAVSELNYPYKDMPVIDLLSIPFAKYIFHYKTTSCTLWTSKNHLIVFVRINKGIGLKYHRRHRNMEVLE